MRGTPDPGAARADADQDATSYHAGSRGDFDRLYRSAYPHVLRFLYGALGDAEAAEDCAQDTFVRAFKAWDRWVPDAPAEAWLHRIAFNVALTYRRKRILSGLRQRLWLGGRPPVAVPPAGPLQELLAALRKLPPTQAAAVVLRHHHGYTNREIAQIQGVSERTVGSRLNIAKARLRAELGPDWDPNLPTSPRMRVVHGEDPH